MPHSGLGDAAPAMRTAITNGSDGPISPDGPEPAPDLPGDGKAAAASRADRDAPRAACLRHRDEDTATGVRTDGRPHTAVRDEPRSTRVSSLLAHRVGIASSGHRRFRSGHPDPSARFRDTHSRTCPEHREQRCFGALSRDMTDPHLLGRHCQRTHYKPARFRSNVVLAGRGDIGRTGNESGVCGTWRYGKADCAQHRRGGIRGDRQ